MEVESLASACCAEVGGVGEHLSSAFNYGIEDASIAALPPAFRSWADGLRQDGDIARSECSSASGMPLAGGGIDGVDGR